MSLLTTPLESVEGAVIWLLVGFSVVTWGLALVKGVQFARQKRQDRQFQKQFWSATSLDSAGEQAQDKQGAGARVAQAGFAAIQVQDNGQPDLAQSINHQDRLERALRQQIQRERRSLESGLAVLASIGSTSPFIGLFGTVWGIMNTFHAIGAMKSASLATVAPGISEALIATAMGLLVAIPATIGYNTFHGSLGVLETRLVNFAGMFLNRVQRELNAHRAVSRSGQAE